MNDVVKIIGDGSVANPKGFSQYTFGKKVSIFFKVQTQFLILYRSSAYPSPNFVIQHSAVHK